MLNFSIIMAKIGEKTWIMEIRPAVLSSSTVRSVILCRLLLNLLWAMLFLMWLFQS